MKRIASLFVGLFAVLAFVSCGETTTSVPPRLSLVLSGLQQPSEKTFFKTFVLLFEAEYGIDVDLSYVMPADLPGRILSERTTGTVTTDIIMVDTANTDRYLDGGWMTDLSWIDADLSDRTFTSLFDEWTVREGKTLFLPVSFDVYISIFNVKALPYMPESVEALRDDENQVIRILDLTWEEFGLWAEAVRLGEGEAKSGFPMASSGSQLLYPMGGMGLAFGADGFPVLNDSGALTAWNQIADWAAAGAILPENILSSSNQPTALLDTETLWLSFGHMGPIGASFKNNPSRYVLGPAPRGTAGGTRGPMAGAWCFGILEGAPHSSAAAKWMKFITSPEINYLYCSNLGGVISPIEEVVERLGDSHTDQIMKVGIESFQQDLEVVVVDTSGYSSWNDVKAVYTDLYRRLLTGEPLSQAEADGFQATLDALALVP